MSTVLTALLFMAGVLVVCGGCIGVAAVVHKSRIAERLWK